MPIPAWVGPAVSAVGSFLGFKSDKDASKRAAQQAERDRQFQMEMAKNQIQWRVADAQKAGIHPIYALGPTGMSYSPPAVVDGRSGDYLASMGQDIGRAVTAVQTRQERAKEVARMAAQDAMARKRQLVQESREGILFDQQVRRNEIEIMMRKSQLARLTQPGTGPGFPDIMNVGPGVSSVNPARTTSPSAFNVGREAGAIRDYGYAYNDEGGLVVVPSYDIHERIEDNFPQQLGWALRNQVMPFFGGLQAPNVREYPVDDPANQRWEWDFRRQAFYPQEFRTGRWVR